MWTTVPPAKSSAPELAEPASAPHPVRDRSVDEDRPERDEREYGPKRMRSTIAPEMSAAVMIANVAWYAANKDVWDRAFRVECHVAEERVARSRPASLDPAEKASE